MNVLGHGIDLVETARIARLLAEHGQRFLDRIYTPGEQEYCRAGGKRQVERLAGRFAAKEAVLKALGTGWTRGVAWTDIDIQPESAGRPSVFLSGGCAKIAAELGITAWLLSISHIETHATASAIAVG